MDVLIKYMLLCLPNRGFCQDLNQKQRKSLDFPCLHPVGHQVMYLDDLAQASNSSIPFSWLAPACQLLAVSCAKVQLGRLVRMALRRKENVQMRCRRARLCSELYHSIPEQPRAVHAVALGVSSACECCKVTSMAEEPGIIDNARQGQSQQESRMGGMILDLLLMWRCGRLSRLCWSAATTQYYF